VRSASGHDAGSDAIYSTLSGAPRCGGPSSGAGVVAGSSVVLAAGNQLIIRAQ
jgi:hypothetical protein